MEIVALGFMGIGFLIAFVGGIWLLIEGFKESVLWGVGMLLFGFVGLIFAVTHWEQAKKPFLLNVGGAALMFLGVLLAPGGGGGAG